MPQLGLKLNGDLALSSSNHQILDTSFELQGSTAAARFFERMDCIYDGVPAVATSSVQVHVQAVSASELIEAVTDWSHWKHFHRSSNYTHWNLEGPADADGIFLPGQGMLFQFDARKARLDVYLDPERATRADELVFHAARNLSLWNRGERLGLMLHASAVVVDGEAWLFMGDKGAGKSTLFIECVLRHGAIPLANDRVLLDAEDGVSTWSWPSYLSYCEGTILDYPELWRVFDGVRTDRGWGVTLQSSLYRRSYEQRHKRIVPPFLLSDVLGRRYCRRAPIAGVINACLDTRHAGGLKLLPYRRTSDLRPETIFNSVFGGADPDFSAWHGICRESHPEVGKAMEAAEWLRAADVPLLEIVLNPALDKSEVGPLLQRHSRARR